MNLETSIESYIQPLLRFLAKKFGDSASVVGITLSGNQAKRAAALAEQQGVRNAEFRVMDALAMDFPDNSFDLVWACESGEHMPDKKRYIEEMTRVLKPGGRIVVATWCQRDENGRPFDKKVSKNKLLYFIITYASIYVYSIHLSFSRIKCVQYVCIFSFPPGAPHAGLPVL